MKLTTTYQGGDTPFEGDHTLLLRSVPANARIVRALTTVTPVQGTAPALFIESIGFLDGVGDLGATKASGSTVTTRWAEVDFHKRRTLASVRGTDLTNATLQVDLGGAFVEINQNGAFKAPDDAGNFTLAGDSGALPSLTVTKFKLTTLPTPNPDIDEVTIRSVPTNVSLRLGEQPPFWSHLGEMTQPQITPDFAPILQAFLDSAKVENGFFVVPLVVHSDTIARLDVTLEVQFVCQETALPESLNEVVLPFDFDGLPQAKADVLQVALPANARVVPRETTARVIGTFDETRIVHGPTGAVTPVASIVISPTASQAQVISLETAVAATAVDVLVAAVSRVARLQLDLRDDLDGKPDSASLLPRPVEVTLDRDVVGEPTWVSVPLRTEFQFAEKTKRRYWLVMQSLEGEATWSVKLAAPETGGMQHTQNGGLSWRDTTVSGVTGLLAAFFRFRRQPERFQVPIELQVGIGNQARRVSLDRFQPLGRVDFALDFDEVAEAFNQYLAEAAPVRCPQGEHVANGDFEQWITVGNNISAPQRIRLNRTPSAVAVSPDGVWTYVGSETDEQWFLQWIDVVCDTVAGEMQLDAGSSPRAIAVHPDRARVYIRTSSELHVVDTVTLKELGKLTGLSQGAFGSLAVSPDGRRLYMATSAFETAGPSQGTVQVLDPVKLEQVIRGQLSLNEAVIDIISFGLQLEPTALAVAPDGRRLYVVIIRHDADNTGEIHLIDTATHSPAEPPLLVEQLPRSIALAPDGERAFVVNSGNNTVSVIDLTRRMLVGPPIDVGGFPVDVVLTPQGDRVYVAQSDDVSLTVIPVGARLPADWALTSGWVTPRCLPDPFHVVAILGPLWENPQPMPTALSQVVPVAGSCPYDFSFWGLSARSGAVAEVLWLSQDCGLLQTDRIPIQVQERLLTTQFASDSLSRKGAVQRPPLVFHRRRLSAPAGAVQAEVRFSVPTGNNAAVDLVSFMATTEAVVNGDLQLQEGNLPAKWTLSPQTAPGFSVVIGERGVALQNAGADTVALVQIVAVQAKQSFALEFQGRAEIRPTAQSNPQIEVHWLKTDGTPAGSPMTLEIVPTGFGRNAATGTVPAEAVQAEVHLNIPAGTSLDVKAVSWQFSEPVRVPLTFVAQAPGELTVSNWRVAYEPVETPPPPVPPEGLCSPTPPGRKPGELLSDCCFCPCCNTEQPLQDVAAAVTPAGRPATIGTCRECGAQLVRQGGQLVPGARRIAIIQPRVRRQVVARFERNRLLERQRALATDIRTILQDPILRPLENLRLSEILELPVAELYARTQQ